MMQTGSVATRQASPPPPCEVQTPSWTPFQLSPTPATPPTPPPTPVTPVIPTPTPTPATPTTPEANDADSAWGDGVSSASMTSSILDFKKEYGRLFEPSGRYKYPVDDLEKERLEFIHEAITRALGCRLSAAPIEPDGRGSFSVLDIGTGTGTWATEFGDKHENVVVEGWDISPIQPVWVPPNVEFLIQNVEDIEEDWDKKFDFIHVRCMAGSIEDWPRLMRRIFRNLAPGGWVEFQEIANTLYSDDDTIDDNNALVKLFCWLGGAHEEIGFPLNVAPHLEERAIKAGFCSVGGEEFKLPIGTWPRDEHLKDIGLLVWASLREGLDGLTIKPFREVLGWSESEVEVLKAYVRNTLCRKSVHTYLKLFVVTGQKPIEATG